ncbi:MAG: hypothetical protein MJA28_06350 [Gammaproteobacteria bacterium]|nr:hypothetical protein [Gammaproteobacteria bacterium]
MTKLRPEKGLSESEIFRRECEINHYYNKLAVKNKSLKSFVSWAAQKSPDYQLRATKRIVPGFYSWPILRAQLFGVPDIHREKMEPILKAEWEKRHGKHSNKSPKTGSGALQAAREYLG